MKKLSLSLVAASLLSVAGSVAHADSLAISSDVNILSNDGLRTEFVALEEDRLTFGNEPEDKFLIDRISGKEVLSPLSSSAFVYATQIFIGDKDYTFDGRNLVINNIESIANGISQTQKINDNWIFLDADQTTIVSDINDADFVIMPTPELSSSFKTLPGDHHLWNECTGEILGRYVGGGKVSDCATKRLISKEFKRFLDNNLLTCIEQGMKVVGTNQKIRRVSMFHDGVTGDARHRNKGGSLHNIERAVDLVKFYVRAANNELYAYSYPNAVKARGSKDGKFFLEFRKCYQSKHIARDARCKMNKAKSGGYVASLGWEDKNHQKHLHISYPFCGGKKGYFKL